MLGTGGVGGWPFKTIGGNRGIESHFLEEYRWDGTCTLSRIWTPKSLSQGDPWLALAGAGQGMAELMVPWAALLTPDKSQTLPPGSLEDDGGHDCQGGQELHWVGENGDWKVNSPLALRLFASGPDFCPSTPSSEATGGSTRVKWPESIEEIPLAW